MQAPRKAVFAVAFLAALASAALPARVGAAEPTVDEVAPGTFAVLQPTARRFNESNSLFVFRPDDLPFGGHGYPASWLAALEELAGMEPKVIVPGHGSVRRGGEHLGLVLEMFRALVGQTAAAAERGLDLEATQAAVDLGTYRQQLAGSDPIAGRAWENFIPPTIERAWLEARGELPD